MPGGRAAVWTSRSTEQQVTGEMPPGLQPSCTQRTRVGQNEGFSPGEPKFGGNHPRLPYLRPAKVGVCSAGPSAKTVVPASVPGDSKDDEGGRAHLPPGGIPPTPRPQLRTREDTRVQGASAGSPEGTARWRFSGDKGPKNSPTLIHQAL